MFMRFRDGSADLLSCLITDSDIRETGFMLAELKVPQHEKSCGKACQLTLTVILTLIVSMPAASKGRSLGSSIPLPSSNSLMAVPGKFPNSGWKRILEAPLGIELYRLCRFRCEWLKCHTSVRGMA
jgi:hypothetical protein